MTNASTHPSALGLALGRASGVLPQGGRGADVGGQGRLVAAHHGLGRRRGRVALVARFNLLGLGEEKEESMNYSNQLVSI